MFKPQDIPISYLDYLGSDLSRRLSSIKANKNDLVVTSQALNKIFDVYNHMTMPIEIIHGEKVTLNKLIAFCSEETLVSKTSKIGFIKN